MKENPISLVIIGGQGPSRRRLKRIQDSVQAGFKAGLIIAADSGLELAHRLGLSPDWAVGDMDSLRNHALLRRLPHNRIRRAPVAKDLSDTEMGLQLAWELGAGTIWLVGGGGGRLDHIVALLRLFDRRPEPARWIGRHSEVIAIYSRLVLSEAVGETISLFPIGDGPWQARSRGLAWPLDNLSWRRGDYGLSNRIVDPAAEISVLEGGFIMVHELRASVGRFTHIR